MSACCRDCSSDSRVSAPRSPVRAGVDGDVALGAINLARTGLSGGPGLRQGAERGHCPKRWSRTGSPSKQTDHAGRVPYLGGA